MMRILSPAPHACLDYIVGLFLLISPWLLHFNSLSMMATNTMVIMGMMVLCLSLLTDYPLGLLKLVPFSTHGIIETLGAVALLISPWVLGFATLHVASAVAVSVSVVWLLVIAMTNYSIQIHHRMVH